jgi:hypothetical protein
MFIQIEAKQNIISVLAVFRRISRVVVYQSLYIQIRVSSTHDFVQQYEERQQKRQKLLLDQKRRKKRNNDVPGNLRFSRNSKNFDSDYS